MDRTQFCQAFHAGIGSDAFVAVKKDRIALTLRHGHRDEFVRERAAGPGGGGALLAPQGIGIRLLATDAIIRRQIVRRLHHALDHAEAPFRLGADAPALQPVMQRDATQPRPPALRRRIEFAIAHRLRTAGDDDVGRARLNHHRGRGDGHHSTAAASLHLHPGDADRQAGIKGASAAQSGRLAMP